MILFFSRRRNVDICSGWISIPSISLDLHVGSGGFSEDLTVSLGSPGSKAAALPFAIRGVFASWVPVVVRSGGDSVLGVPVVGSLLLGDLQVLGEVDLSFPLEVARGDRRRAPLAGGLFTMVYLKVSEARTKH